MKQITTDNRTEEKRGYTVILGSPYIMTGKEYYDRYGILDIEGMKKRVFEWQQRGTNMAETYNKQNSYVGNLASAE